MLEWIRKFDLRKAGICSVVIGGVNIIVHILVITNIIPYLWVYGGRTESFAAAQQTSTSSIVMTIANILITLIASQIIPVKLNKFWGIALSIFLIITLPLKLVGVIQQFLGTTFEKCVMGIVTIIGFCADTRIAFEKRWYNPWEEIILDDYENHMRLDSVMQLQAMNQMMKNQLEDYPVSSAMILGVAGGNGLEYVQKDKYEKVYGVDINSAYLQESVRRYPDLTGVLECLRIDLMSKSEMLPEAELLIANLLIEYIGYESFQNAVLHTNPKYVSCIIQHNTDENWVSDSPYLHVFDGLEKVHQQIDELSLESLMRNIGYHIIKVSGYPLPNGKKLVRMDYKK